MANEIRLWRVNSEDDLKEISHARLNLEERIENWLENDISMISTNLLVIGRQIKTVYGKYLDLLCIDDEGDLVIVELKRDKTPRDVTAQILDYASWVKDLSNKEITDIADSYLYKFDSNLEETFENKFDKELPEVLNENHKMLIVASRMDGSTERIINYLSDEYGVGINVVTFQYFKDENNKEFIGRVFLIEPDQVDYNVKTKSGSKRRSSLSYEELKSLAEENDVIDIYEKLVNEFNLLFDISGTTLSSITFSQKQENGYKTVAGLYPKKSSKEEGLFFKFYIKRIADYFDIRIEDILDNLPSRFTKDIVVKAWSGGPLKIAGFFKNQEEIDNFVGFIKKLKV